MKNLTVNKDGEKVRLKLDEILVTYRKRNKGRKLTVEELGARCFIKMGFKNTVTARWHLYQWANGERMSSLTDERLLIIQNAIK